jgi:tyrosine-protein phosphatase SIW14
VQLLPKSSDRKATLLQVMNVKSKSITSLLSLSVAFAVMLCAAGQRGLPPQDGITNFGKVNEHLYRGAQPDEAGITNLARLGVKMIINLRMPDDVWKGEEAAARASGITYTNVPMHAIGRPTDEQVSRVLSIIETSSSPVFVHCEHGCDRTGTIIACYRISHDKWPGDSALREADLYGMSKLERGMRKYIVEFANSRK